MTADASSIEHMLDHLRDIARRVGGCGGDLEAIRAVIEDYSQLDPSTRRVDARAKPSASPKGEWIVADNCLPDHRLLYVHGGSWMSGSPQGYRPLAARIAASTGCAVFVVDYRLAPENPFPAGLDDCVSAFEWLASHGPDTDTPARRRVIGGDSAGGNLALAAVLKLKILKAALPDAVIVLSPAVDLTWSSPSLDTRADVDPILRPDRLHLVSEGYIQGVTGADDPLVSPVFGDFTGLPRLLVQVGDREVLLDDSRRITELARRQGIETELQIYPGMPHVFQLFAPTVASASEAIAAIGTFVEGACFSSSGTVLE